MKKIGVLGAGMVGSAIAIDLATTFHVTIFDSSEPSLERLSTKNNKIKTVRCDLSDYQAYPQLLEAFDLVVIALPGFMGYKALKAVITSNKNLVDISFSPENALQLDALAKQHNVTAIVDCGVAPGMSNLILGHYNKIMHVESFECMVGGLPKQRISPFEYKAPFSPIDVIEEYIRPAKFIENGELVTRPALTDPEIMNFEGIGDLESFNTDGLRSLIVTMRHINNLKEKTLRYPGHIDLIKKLKQGGFFDTEKITVSGIEISPLEFSSKILFEQWKLEEGEIEFTVMKIKIAGIENGKEKTVIYDLYDEYDPISKTTSMARTTGYTCNAAVNLISNNLFNRKGIFPPELIGEHEECFNFIIDYLFKRGINYRKTELD